MTRNVFDSRYAATLETTSGFTAAQLAGINDAVFDFVSQWDEDDDFTAERVQRAFEFAFAAR